VTEDEHEALLAEVNELSGKETLTPDEAERLYAIVDLLDPPAVPWPTKAPPASS
jgi:hypothetical protein